VERDRSVWRLDRLSDRDPCTTILRGEKMPNLDAGERKLWRVLDVALVSSFLVVALRVLNDVRLGGHGFKQGDYLINSIVEPVRRGQFGTGVIWVSDLLGSNPLYIVAAFQIVMLVILYMSVRTLFRAIGRAELALLLALSAAFFVTFWVADPQGSIRKELIAFAGLALLASGSLARSNLKIAMGAVVFCVALVSHEAMALLLPACAAIFVIGRDGPSGPRLVWALAGLIALTAAYTAWYTLTFTEVGAPDRICLPLLERGVGEHVCGGAIAWLQHDMDYGMRRVADMLDGPGIAKFAVGYLVSLLPFGLISLHQDRPRVFLFGVLIAALPFVPLYVVAIDWGRWIGLHVFSVTVLFSMLLATGQARSDFPIRRPQFYGLLALGVVLSPSHVLGILTIIR
jgi:hypothetical protein